MPRIPRRMKRGQRTVEIRTTENPRVLTRYTTEGYFSQEEIEEAGRVWVAQNHPSVPATALEFRYYPEFTAPSANSPESV